MNYKEKDLELNIPTKSVPNSQRKLLDAFILSSSSRKSAGRTQRELRIHVAGGMASLVVKLSKLFKEHK